MNVEQKIILDRFKPRSYQLPILDAIENKGYRRVLAIMPRRAGKDITAFNLCIRHLLRRTCVIYYVFPTYAQGKKVLWDSITNTGERILSFLPEELIASINSQEMKIRLVNGSLFQVVGSDNFDSLVGTNPQGVVFSEFALQDPRAYQFIRPILAANQGWCLMISTPRGKNHMWELYNIAQQSPDWFCYRITLDDTKHIPLAEIEADRRDGTLSEDMIQQEYYVSFSLGVEGSYYSKYLDKMRLSKQIGEVPWETGFQVHTAWDLGVRDSTCIIFFQIAGQIIRIIDCYENNKEGMEHYKQVLDSKPYSYGKHFAPHDIGVTEWGTGLSRLEKARQLGLKFEYKLDKQSRAVSAIPNVSLMDGIEAVRTTLPRCWVDEEKCRPLLNALENYRQEFDHKMKVYTNKPLHNWACFEGSTFILTRNGIRQIMDITEDDLVLSDSGWVPCKKARITGQNAPLVKVTFQNYTNVKCTPEHKFLTVKGWISAERLEKGLEIQSSLTSWCNILTDICIDIGQVKDILQKAGLPCIDPYGEMPLGIYQSNRIFITKTLIPSTTISGIWNVSQREIILKCLDQIIRGLAQRLEMLQENGINLKKEDCGIRDKQSDLNLGKNGNEKNENVLTVIKNLKHLYGKMAMHRNIVTTTANPLIIESVEPLNERADVYCINVPTKKHFSLANGAIVHNSHFSDAMRYLALSLPKTRDGVTKEELDRSYARAMYGTDSNVPAFFRDHKGY